ncbi:MAG TPA: DUF1592 domain-containing protein [Polyangia bacterium]|nr:DUF1592 domain-containing protein [Polyangia bacterium]
MCGAACKDVTSDQQNCGKCGNACGAGETCQSGQCLCSAGLLNCGGACVPPDATHCGGCSQSCASGQVCSANSCQSSCGAGETQCANGACIDVLSNALNCGSCGNQCPAGSVCSGGACGCSGSGQMLCGNACIDVMSDVLNCGGCGQACNGTCTNGLCATVSGGTPLLPPSVRRMTNAEYDASVQALLGTTQTPSTNFPPDSRQIGGYTLNDAQRIDPVLAKALDDAAQALVTEARGNNKLATLAPCSNSTTGGEACAKTFINSFGAQAFRRAVAADELTDLVTLYHAGADSPGTYTEGIDLVARGILESVGFMYITQLGGAPVSGKITLTSDELASNLSYLVAGGPPDSTLTAAGAAGSLATPDGREQQVRRLLATQPGHDRMVRVVREWLGIDQISDTAKDATVYATFSTAVRTSMDTESKNFIDEVAQRSTGSVGELLSANWSIVDSTLAPIYGTTSAGTTAHTMLPKRLGILNQAAFLSVFAHAQETAPVLRGVAVMRRVACITMPDPTTLNIVVVPPMPDPTKSTRDRYAIHATDAACASCHDTIDQIGFAFELFDGMGAQRPASTTAGKLVDSHLPVTNGKLTTADTTSSTTIAPSAQFPADFTGTYADSNALATALGNSAQVRECLARQFFRSSSGRNDTTVVNAEQSFVDSWKQLSADSQGKFNEVLVAYVRSQLFDTRSAQ